MNKEAIFDIYPWYRQHQHAVDTVAKFLESDLEQILIKLDGKIYPHNESAVIETSDAA